MKTIKRLKAPDHLKGATDCLAIGNFRPVEAGGKQAQPTQDCPLQPPYIGYQWKADRFQTGGERQAVRLASELAIELRRLRKALRKCRKCREYTQSDVPPVDCPWRSRLQGAIQALADEISQDWE